MSFSAGGALTRFETRCGVPPPRVSRCFSKFRASSETAEPPKPSARGIDPSKAISASATVETVLRAAARPHAGTGNPVEPLPDVGLSCVAGEAMMRGEEGFDYGNWRASALASYAADGYTYPSNLAFSPTTVLELNESMTTIANELLNP
jgi:hypothetical protein